ncbi:MAG: hypothetical protein AAGI17_09810, partial [Planctomycetota bacterium]
MKLKGITIFEQAADKIVVGLVTLALLAVVTLQFLVPTTVEVDPNQSRAPGEVYAYLGTKANRLLGQMEGEATLEAFETPELSESLQAGLAPSADAGGVAIAAIPAAAPALPQLGDVLAGPDGPVALLDLPQPTAPVVASQYTTVDPYFLSQRPALASRLAEMQQPYDMPLVTIEAQFNSEALVESLLSPPEGERAIPNRWLDRGLEIIAVQAERQKKNFDGTWAEPELVSSVPWMPALEELSPAATIDTESVLPDNATVADLDAMAPEQLLAIVAAARSNQEFIATPPAVPAISGPEWLPPNLTDERDARAVAEREVERLEGVIEELEERRSRIAGGNATNQAQANIERRIEQAQDQLSDQQQIVRDLADLQAEIKRFSLRGGESVAVWTHDMDAEPGATYRYRLRIVTNNPLFGEGPRLNAEDNPTRLSAAEEATVASEWSDWTGEVEVGRRQYLFVSGAQPGGALVRTEPSATVELFYMYYGYYRRDVISLSPGEPVTGRIELPENLWLYSVDGLDVDAAATFFTDLARFQDDEDAEEDDR